MLYWAIIGSGDVVKRLVAKSFNVPKKSKVKYIFSHDLKEAKKLTKKYNFGKVVKNVNVIANDKSINCVYIATPPNSHYIYLKKFANARKNILCEKPLAINPKHINLIKNICKRNRVSLIAPFYRRHLKRFNYIKKLLTQKKIGKIIFFRITLTHSPSMHPTAPININKLSKKNIPWRFKKNISGGGNFLDMGSHAIDMVSFLLGNIKKIHSLKKNYTNYYDVEDTLITNIQLNNGIIGQGVWSSVTKKTSDSFEVFGTRGYIKFSMSFSDRIELFIGNKKFVKTIPFEKPFHKKLIRYVVNKFVNKIRSNSYFIDENSLKITALQLKALENN